MKKLIEKLLSLLSFKFGLSTTVSAATVLVMADEGFRSLLLSVVGDFVVDEVNRKTGLVLDRSAPLSDASLARAVSARSGVEIRSVYDTKILVEDVKVWAADSLEEKSGLRLTDMTDELAIRDDVAKFGAGLVKEHTGITLTNILAREAVEADLKAHIADRLTALVADRLREAAADFTGVDKNVEEMLGMMRRVDDWKNVKPFDVGLGVAASVVVASYAALNQTIAKRVRQFRRQAQNREAQRRFRETWGNRMRYNPLEPS